MGTTQIKLVAPDARICSRCHGSGWLYVYDAKVKHLQHRLVKCDRTDRHVAVIWKQDGEEIELGPVVSRA